MEDNAIIDLYFKRSEQAIVETDAKYGGYCYSIAYNILSNREDSEESVSDTYMAAWNTIPPRLRTPVRWCRHSAGHGALISASWCTLSAEDGAPVPFPVVHGGRGRWCTAAMLGLYF